MKKRNLYSLSIRTGLDKFLPPKQEGFRNFDIIQLTSCDDGCLITVEGNMEEVARELSTFVGYPIVEIYCDTNEITNYGYTFKGCKYSKRKRWRESYLFRFLNYR